MARHDASELSTAARYEAQFSDLPVGDDEPPSVRRKALAYGALIIVAGVLVTLLGALVAI
ncbi:hypothetical protein FY036_15840 [Mesorhizobium microcysteis]|uniref:Uncharacterized protein n=1 Tax=Neoaquamicrobium microcysteis TaxID=2682781 RepID=A0A5D4GS95_9HYPH|nr:hypothetical protein [Mesorhizobium microcysteis]TYR30922.1 hypothetical protein FY036_15840 [Mesorhizobium microcysteis]